MASSASQAFVDEVTNTVLGRIAVALSSAARAELPKRGRPRKRQKAVADSGDGVVKRKRGRPKKSEATGSATEHELVAAL